MTSFEEEEGRQGWLVGQLMRRPPSARLLPRAPVGDFGLLMQRLPPITLSRLYLALLLEKRIMCVPRCVVSCYCLHWRLQLYFD
eukprot:SAG31_NODE_2885_length_4953_cov_4.633498_4_plen_84_part_00